MPLLLRRADLEFIASADWWHLNRRFRTGFRNAFKNSVMFSWMEAEQERRPDGVKTYSSLTDSLPDLSELNDFGKEEIPCHSCPRGRRFGKNMEEIRIDYLADVMPSRSLRKLWNWKKSKRRKVAKTRTKKTIIITDSATFAGSRFSVDIRLQTHLQTARRNFCFQS